MARLFLLLSAGLWMFCAPVYASEDELDLETIAEAIQEGEIDVGDKLSMDFKKGRFHNIHVDTLGLDCATCHYGKVYQDDYLLVRKYEYLRKRAKGQANRQACVACHQSGGIATTFYIERAGRK